MLQDGVADRVAVDVVDGLEVVEVDQHERGAGGRAGGGEGGGHRVVQHPPGDQAGEPVDGGHPLELGDQRGHVLHAVHHEDGQDHQAAADQQHVHRDLHTLARGPGEQQDQRAAQAGQRGDGHRGGPGEHAGRVEDRQREQDRPGVQPGGDQHRAHGDRGDRGERRRRRREVAGPGAHRHQPDARGVHHECSGQGPADGRARGRGQHDERDRQQPGAAEQQRCGHQPGQPRPDGLRPARSPAAGCRRGRRRPAGTDRGRAAVTQGRSGGHDQDIDRRGDQLCASCRAATPWGGGVGPWSRAQIGTGRCSPW
ncbi:unannotated protein [freshwater metagenome]|uniref:Unannotated protein n=1 Tax=freshwater metagenome TaxID=449393 RepID=A0A6J7J0S4_9ZZZZ